MRKQQSAICLGCSGVYPVCVNRHQWMKAGCAVGLGLVMAFAGSGTAFARDNQVSDSGTARRSSSGTEAELATKRARQTYREGVDAFNRSDYEAARVAFLQTLALKPNVPEVRRNLGLAEIYSGHYLEGARRVARVLHSPSAGSPQNRTRMLESLKKAEAHLERITIEVDVDGALVEMDGEALGESPITHVWYVSPGHYDLRVSKAGYVTYRERKPSGAGEVTHLRISLAVQPPEEPEPEPAAASPALAGPPRDNKVPARPNLSVLVAGGVVTAAALAGAGYFFSDARSLEAELDQAIADLPEETPLTSCVNLATAPAVCRELDEMGRQHESRRELVMSLEIVAAVAAVGTVGYWLWPRGTAEVSKADSLSVRHVGLTMGADRAAFQLSGTF